MTGIKHGDSHGPKDGQSRGADRGYEGRWELCGGIGVLLSSGPKGNGISVYDKSGEQTRLGGQVVNSVVKCAFFSQNEVSWVSQ